jgi:monomeric sarcosine oxidase
VYQKRITIVGAGIVGLSTAFALLKQGIKHVTVLDQFTVNHYRGSSSGILRLIRLEYGTKKFYTEMVQSSLKLWKSLQQHTQRTLYTPTGLLVLGHENDTFTRPSYDTLCEAGYTPELLTGDTCIQRFPQFNPQGYDLFTYNTEAGMLHASTCLQTLKDAVIDLGGSILENVLVTEIIHDNHCLPLCLHLSTREKLTADHVVLATGPWVQQILGGLDLPIRLTRQYVLYFANLPPATFGLNTFPSFLANDLYGFPIYNTCTGSGPRWLKAASHQFGAIADPNDISIIDERVIKEVTTQLHDLIPDLRQAKLAKIGTCIYDVSPDEDFILDQYPGDSRITFATGLSGHGFKFGLLLGEMLSSMVCETESVIPLGPFRLARFAHKIPTLSVT